jgi:hypothetical protein
MGSTLKELFLDSVKALKPPPPGVYLHQLWPADIARLADVDSIPGIRRLRESPGWSKSGEAKIVSLAGIQRQTSFDTIGSVIRRVRNGELEVFPITGKPTLHEDEVCICRFSLRSLEDAIAFSRVIEHIEKAAELEKANREQYLKEGDKAISVAS